MQPALEYSPDVLVGRILPKSTYASWAAAMKLRLQERGLWFVTANQELSDQVTNDQALATILLGLGRDIQAMFISENDPARLWTALEEEFGGDEPSMPPPPAVLDTLCADDWVVVHNHTNNQTSRRNLFRNYQPFKDGEKKVLFENKTLHAAGRGKVDLCFHDPLGVLQTLTITALHVPQAKYNIFSLAANKLALRPDASLKSWEIQSQLPDTFRRNWSRGNPADTALAVCKLVNGRRVLRCTSGTP